MIEVFSSVNYIAILVCTVIASVLGSLWYSTFFGKAWMKEMKITPEQVAKAKKQSMAHLYLVNFISTFVMLYVFALFLSYMAVSSWIEGLIAAVVIWVGFIATLGIGGILWEGKSIKLYFINMLYWLVLLLISGAILAVW